MPSSSETSYDLFTASLAIIKTGNDLLAMLLASLYLIFYSFEINPNITYLIAPYTVWLIFALMLNFKLVNMEINKPYLIVEINDSKFNS